MGGGASKKQNSPNHSSNDSDISPQIQHHSTLGQKIYKRFYRKTFCAIAKHFFALLKNYKRYYLGKPRLKMCCYMFINNEQKASKYKQRHNNRYENINNSKSELAKSLSSYAMLRKLATQIKIWLNSKEFKEKYIDTNHPYPPLLNPNSIPYDSISTELAWEFNLPLPPKYKFILIMASFTGHTSIVRSLQKCGVTIQDHIYSIKKQYALYYDALQNDKCCVLGIYVYELYDKQYFDDNLKFVLLSNDEIPILWLVRDPFSRLKTMLINTKNDAIYNFDKYTNLTLLENRFAYFNNLDEVINSIASPYSSFHYGDLYNFLCKWKFIDIEFLDFAELAPDKIFDTCFKLSKKYGFSAPTNVDDFNKKTYVSIYQSYFIKPFIYNICGINFSISIHKSNDIEVSKKLSLDKGDFEQEIYIYTEKSNLDKVQTNKNDIKYELQNFINNIRKVLNFESEFYKTSENALIDLLLTQPKQRNLLKNIFEKEVSFARKIRPDIVTSWKYYNKFEKICAKLDNK